MLDFNEPMLDFNEPMIGFIGTMTGLNEAMAAYKKTHQIKTKILHIFLKHCSVPFESHFGLKKAILIFNDWSKKAIIVFNDCSQ